ncbi:MAG: HAMP domain-containing protein [Nitrospirae bacterium]|nr:HAMP domain-containing protein [Nitrospirota bacterium]
MFRIFRTNLQNKITLSILTVGFISTVLGLALVYTFGKSTLKQTIGRGYAELAEVTSNRLETMIDHHLEEAHFLSSTLDITNIVEKSNLSGPVRNQKQIEANWAKYTETDPVIRTIIQNEASLYFRGYEAFENKEKENSGIHRFIYATNIEGNVIASDKKTPLYNYKKEKWWQTAYAEGKGKVFISDIVFDPAVNDYTFNIASPIYRNGSIIGILNMVHNADIFFKWVTYIKSGKRDHTMLASSDGTLLFCPIFPTKTHQLTAELQKNIFKSEAGWSVSNADVHYPGREALNGFAPLDITFHSGPDNFGGKSWYVFTSQDPLETFAPIYTLLKWILSAGVLGFGVLTFLGWIVSKNLVKPIRDLQTGIQLIGDGQLDHRINLKTGDEIEDVGNEFNEMAKKMQTFYFGLEQKVSERTKELEIRTRELELRNNEMYTLFSMGATLNECETREEILSVTPGKVMGMMKADGVIISLMDSSADIFLKGIPSSLLKQPESKVFFEKIMHVFLNKKDFFICLNAGVENGSNEVAIPDSFDFSTTASVPLFSKKEVTGGLTLLFKRPHPLSGQEEELLTAIGHQVGNAIENVRKIPPVKKL